MNESTVSPRCFDAILPAGATVLALHETESTSTLLRAMLLDGRAQDGSVILADRQTGGRGRHGKSFCSPEGGLYFSLLLRERRSAPYTVLCGAAVCRVLQKHGAAVGIKWVNDLFYDGKKVCGVLCERVVRDDAPYLILGIGINCFGVHLDAGLDGIAGTLPPLPVDRGTLAAEIVAEILRLAGADNDSEPRRYYAENMMLYGKRVRFEKDGATLCGTVLGLGENESLCVRLDDGSETELTSGMVFPL